MEKLEGFGFRVDYLGHIHLPIPLTARLWIYMLGISENV